MSASHASWTVPRFLAAKAQGQKLVMVTVYDYLWAQIAEEAGIDALLVGDSVGMVVQGHSSTLPVTMRQMLYHAEMVARAVTRPLVIADLPYLSYHLGASQAVRNAGLLLKRAGVAAVKLEVNRHHIDIVRALTAADIPVMVHLGLRPQAIRMLGGMKIQRDEKELLSLAESAVQAGAFALLLELVPAAIARKITQEVPIPTIGIGAGADCDGQVLVGPDLLGLTSGFAPRYLKRFGQLREAAHRAFADYADEVRRGCYPDSTHSHD